MSRYSRPPNTSLYVRNVPDTTRSEELRSLFGKYGPISDTNQEQSFKPRLLQSKQAKCKWQRVNVNVPNSTFEDPRDAEDALYHLDRTRFFGCDLEIEFARGDRKTPSQMRTKERGAPYSSRHDDYRSERRGRRSFRSRSRSPYRRSRSPYRRGRSRSRSPRYRGGRSRSRSPRRRSRSPFRARDSRKSRSRSRSPSFERKRSVSPRKSFSRSKSRSPSMDRSPRVSLSPSKD
ncbi:hypothetical protein CAPTEDRAFT_222121 [Capitella teleta]|uniref:RRM domain-containing protein n=1 Tax=Capitella teleta TaxID=283909 RepID=R7V4R7_CAPTE|nr:hypothetical protein CAPTEDRAFT_222121 [Capitella teleta]|eukprot:ELU13843.1 hypothetical protein CAPTEDRAFT_222121 [Capitella teleta]